ncbi:hypothetical protein K435DRAFT_799979 [Dendrothele bispora CBS 962.96]|uniref:Uncharacterized protein n=1 Tax=Dendrothele bispora (strain CBS 962.96) TaxID=1314807 RepID=A0A4V4HF19_DENBC|nr:hypothetical protein K435DRAFT_799979 [Dendrothele bispora CBS 962.96]
MAVPPLFMSQPLRRNNGQRQVASSPAQPTNSSETRSSDFQHVTRSSPAPSDSRATARPSSDQEDATAGLKHAYVSGSEQQKRQEKAMRPKWRSICTRLSGVTEQCHQVSLSPLPFAPPMLLMTSMTLLSKTCPTRRFLDMLVPIIFSYRYSLLAKAKSRARGQIPPALIEALCLILF